MNCVPGISGNQSPTIAVESVKSASARSASGLQEGNASPRSARALTGPTKSSRPGIVKRANETQREVSISIPFQGSTAAGAASASNVSRQRRVDERRSATQKVRLGDGSCGLPKEETVRVDRFLFLSHPQAVAPFRGTPRSSQRRPGPAPARRTQGERSAETRARVLDAALECLARDGYRGTTTTAVTQRAGVSRGAQLHHFPTRAALVSAALQHLHAELTEHYEKGFASLDPRADRLDAAVELLWRVMRDPRLDAAIELTVAARTDADLRREVATVARAHRARIGRLARAYFPEEASAPDFDARVDLVLDALQGLVLRCRLHGEGTSVARSLTLVKALAAGGGR